MSLHVTLTHFEPYFLVYPGSILEQYLLFLSSKDINMFVLMIGSSYHKNNIVVGRINSYLRVIRHSTAQFKNNYIAYNTKTAT
jgi:hypothetical protein